MKRVLFLMLTVNFVALPTAGAAVSDADFEQLREQLAAVSQRLEELAAENAELRSAQDQAATAIADVQTSVNQVQEIEVSAAAESWSDRIRLDGDFRYRYENIDPEGSPGRERNRIRARANIRADLMDDVARPKPTSTSSIKSARILARARIRLRSRPGLPSGSMFS